MGCGLAQLAAQNGFSVKVFDSVPEALERAPRRIAEALCHAVGKGKLIQSQADAAFKSLVFVKSLEDLRESGLIIEAASEDLRLKQRIFKELGGLSAEAVLATNTSSLPVWSLAQVTAHPQRVVGMHFFNPPAAMKLVEVARTSQTQDEYFKIAWNVALALKKIPVEVKDTPGYIVNRVLRPYYLSALRLANEGAGIVEVDKAARELGGVPMGPFELMDLIGLDVNNSITKVIYEALGSPERLRPSAIQEWLVNAGNTGRKAGKGFYLYRDGQVRENPEVRAILPEPVAMAPEMLWQRIMTGVYEEAQMAYEENVASQEDIDTAVKLATNFPRGPFEWQKSKKTSAR